MRRGDAGARRPVALRPAGRRRAASRSGESRRSRKSESCTSSQRPRVAVVVVAAAVEHVRLELAAGEDGRHQVVGRRRRRGPRCRGAARPLATAPRTCTSSCIATTGRTESPVSGAARVEVDERRRPGRSKPIGVAPWPQTCVVRRLSGRAVVVDEVDLLRGVEARAQHRSRSSRRRCRSCRPAPAAGRCEMSSAPKTVAHGNGEEVEARRARRILRAPPGVDRGHVAGDPRGPVGEAVRRAPARARR